MNADIEVLLRQAMDRATSEIPAPTGLAARTARKLRRRQLAVRSVVPVTVITVATAIGVSTGTGIGSRSATAPRPQTAAYVVHRVDGALSQVPVRKLVEQVYTSRLSIRDSVPRPRVPSQLAWYYRERSRIIEFGLTGRAVVELASPSGIAVDYLHRTWARQLDQARRLRVNSHGCATEPTSRIIIFTATPSFIQATLACGGLVYAGRVRVNGVMTIKLVSARQEPYSVTLYVSSSSYLPVRLVESGVQQDFRWFPAIAAYRAQLNVWIPAHYRQVPKLDWHAIDIALGL
jgi:hypothetical protein